MNIVFLLFAELLIWNPPTNREIHRTLIRITPKAIRNQVYDLGFKLRVGGINIELKHSD